MGTEMIMIWRGGVKESSTGIIDPGKWHYLYSIVDIFWNNGLKYPHPCCLLSSKNKNYKNCELNIDPIFFARWLGSWQSKVPQGTYAATVRLGTRDVTWVIPQGTEYFIQKTLVFF